MLQGLCRPPPPPARRRPPRPPSTSPRPLPRAPPPLSRCSRCLFFSRLDRSAGILLGVSSLAWLVRLVWLPPESADGRVLLAREAAAVACCLLLPTLFKLLGPRIYAQ